MLKKLNKKICFFEKYSWRRNGFLLSSFKQERFWCLKRSSCWALAMQMVQKKIIQAEIEYLSYKTLDDCCLWKCRFRKTTVFATVFFTFFLKVANQVAFFSTCKMCWQILRSVLLLLRVEQAETTSLHLSMVKKWHAVQGSVSFQHV